MKLLPRYVAAVLLFLFAVTAFSQAVVAPSSSGVVPQITSNPAQQVYRLGAGDSIGIQVYQSPDLLVDERVAGTGVIGYPLVGSLQLGGLTISETEKKIADSLQTGGFVKAPQVNSVLRQARGSQVAVLGQVCRPGRFSLETLNVRVSDMLAAAGGRLLQVTMC